MSIALVRVDDRLIHGQVVVGWAQALRIDRIVLVDDAASTSEWEQELYALGVPPEIQVQFASVEAAAATISDWARDRHRTIILAPDVETVARLSELSDTVTHVNLGGVHAAEARAERLPYLHLSEAEAQRLTSLSERGVIVTAQDVPTAAPIRLADLL